MAQELRLHSIAQELPVLSIPSRPPPPVRLFLTSLTRSTSSLAHRSPSHPARRGSTARRSSGWGSCFLTSRAWRPKTTSRKSSFNRWVCVTLRSTPIIQSGKRGSLRSDTDQRRVLRRSRINLGPLRYLARERFHFHLSPSDSINTHTLTHSHDQIEYASGGGGLYSTSSDFIKLLHHLLQHKLSLTRRAPRPKSPLLSDASLDMLFTGRLSDQLTQHVITMFAFGFGTDETFALGEGNWSAGMAMYTPKDGRRRMGWGRRASSVGWGGSAGAEYWIDVDSGLAVSGHKRGSGAVEEEIKRDKVCGCLEKLIPGCIRDALSPGRRAPESRVQKHHGEGHLRRARVTVVDREA